MTVSKVFTLESSHQLPLHPGKCARLHGHSWRVTVQIHGTQNPKSHFVLDYNHLSHVVDPLVNFLDHRHLNYVCQYPSSENILQLFAVALLPLLGAPNFNRLVVKVAETLKTESVWDSELPYDRDLLMRNSGYHMPHIPDAAPDGDFMTIGEVSIRVMDLRAIQEDWKRARRDSFHAISRIIFEQGGPASNPGGGSLTQGGTSEQV